MLRLHLLSCIIFISCIFQASLLPLNTIIKNINRNNNNYEELKSYYYLPSSRRANEVVHDLPLNDNDDSIIKSEMMESSASNYYSSHHHQHDDDDEYSDYTSAAGAEVSLSGNFESEKIKPSVNNNDSKKLITTNSTEMILSEMNTNSTQLQPQQQQQQQQQHVPNLNVENTNTNTNNDNNKFSKLLFSSPSATVTSNGPSGPFKAIICHDCDVTGGANVGHSVSFSAIKSWNVGSSSNVTPKSSFNESLVVKQNHQDYNVSGVVEHKSEKYLDVVINSNSNKDSDAQINQNVPIVVENQGSVFKSETVNDNEQQQQQQQEQQQQQQQMNKDWNYSLLTVRNENIKVNNPSQSPSPSSSPSSSSVVATQAAVNINDHQKKPIFNDLLKVPYDVLNAPLTESPPTSSPETIKKTQIHINHQQKFNDTITNYQHFQQFIQKNPSPSNANHYQSTAMPEQNYEVDESVSLMTNGRAHGIQSTTPKINLNSHVGDQKNGNENRHTVSSSSSSISPLPPSPLHVTHPDSQDANKFGVVFEGRDFRKYKVEEKTADGFIVGEYGYLRNTDGSPIFQGVRYTADSNINPQLIYDALLKFLKL